MTIGETDQLVTFEAPGPPVPDGHGGFTYDWMPLVPAQWYVRLQPVSAAGAERLQPPGTVVTHTGYRVQAAYHAGVTTQVRFRDYRGRVFQVTSVVNVDDRGVDMELLADLQS